MSSRKGDVKKKGQKYQNSTAFKNNLHDTSHTTKLINSTSVVGVCARCKETIEWRKKFKKYKPLKAPKKCVKCEQRTIKHAYHTYCTKCAREGGFCEKCGENKDIAVRTELSAQERAAQESSIQQDLKMLSERERRTYLRQLERGEEAKLPGTNHCQSNIESDEEREEFDDEES